MNRKISLLFIIIFWAVEFKAHAQRADFPFADFDKPDSVAALYPRFPLKNVKLLADTLTSPFDTEVEKFRAIFRWVATNIDYDVELYLKDAAKEVAYRRDPKQLRRWKQTFGKLVYSKLPTHYTTVCAGYAKLVDDLCMHAGIESKVIEGFGRTSTSPGDVSNANHAWNAVRLDGKWYLCDATWSAGFADLQTRKFKRDFTEAFFLTPPQQFIRRHYPSDTAWSLLLKKPTHAEFSKFPLFYRPAYLLQINSVSPNEVNVNLKRGEIFRFAFTTNHPSPFEHAYLYIDDGKKQERSVSALTFNEDGEYSMEHTFQQKGTYRVIVYLNWSPCVEYTLRVK